MAIDGHVVRFFMRSDEDANLNLVVLVRPQERSERVTRLKALGQVRIEARLRIEGIVVASDVRFVNLGQIAGGAVWLGVRSGISNSQRHWLVAIVNSHRALIGCGNGFRTGRRLAIRTN